MLTLSNKILYAIEAVVDIAYHSNGQPVQSHRISCRQLTPSRYLEQSLQKLVKGNVLMGVRGPRGGYQLAKHRCSITIGEIVRIITGPEAETLLENNLTHSEISEKILNPIWGQIENTILDQLDQITIEHLCIKADEHAIKSDGCQTLDYAI